MKKWLLIFIGCILAFNSSARPLPADEVFKVSVARIDPNTFAVNWQIKSGYYLYSDRIKLNPQQNNTILLGDVRFPPTLTKTDTLGHHYTIYRHQLSLPVAILGEEPGEALLTINYQGCADDGFCYPPETQQIKLAIDDKLALSTVELYTAEAVPETSINNPPLNSVESVFLNHHWSMILLIFFGFGLLLSFTPCVLPMVPVLSGIIVGHGKTLTTYKAFFLSLSYVISMALTYALVGAVVALLGSNLQILMQSPWAIGLFSLLFILLALSMFDYFELKLPVSWQAKLASVTRSQGSGHYLSAAIMGCLSTLILSPCVTAPLIGVLSYIAHSGSVVMGAFSLFFLGLGMGTPLILIGTSAGRWLPKAGRWMNAVKYFFGVMLIAVAISLLARILPNYYIMVMWATLLIFSGVYCGALIPAHSHHEKFRQAAGIIFLIYGVLIIIGASMGNSNPLQPLANRLQLAPTNETSTSTLVNTVADVEDALLKTKGKMVMLDFYADWCASCKVMDATTFTDPKVLSALQKVVILKADITADTPEHRALLKHYNVVAPPTFVFFNKQGGLLPQQLVGEMNSLEFLKQFKEVKE